MNPLETFGEFSKKLTPTDLALYAGVGIVLWVLFKDQLSPVQKAITDLFNKPPAPKVVVPVTPVTVTPSDNSNTVPDADVFFNLVASWKQTRDLAVRTGCTKAVEVADQMFPYLSPVICKEEKKNESAKT